jgi:hypothetical protein
MESTAMARRSKTPARRPSKSTPPNWGRLRTRFKAVMKDVKKEVGHSWTHGSRQLERELEAKLLPSLKRAQRKLEGLIVQLEKRI